MTVSVNYLSSPDVVPEGLAANEYIPGHYVRFTCLVQGASGSLSYSWSVEGNPDTPSGCGGNCAIRTSTTSNFLVYLYSYHAGTYTCSVSESGWSGSGNSDSYTIRVVGVLYGVWMFHLQVIKIVKLSIHAGAGIYSSIASGGYDNRAITNNGMIIVDSRATSGDFLRFECVSNSSRTGVGEITGRDGNTLTTGGIWTIRQSPGVRPGLIRVGVRSEFTASDQGIYTCTIPDANSNNIAINFGLYPNGFNGE